MKGPLLSTHWTNTWFHTSSGEQDAGELFPRETITKLEPDNLQPNANSELGGFPQSCPPDKNCLGNWPHTNLRCQEQKEIRTSFPLSLKRTEANPSSASACEIQDYLALLLLNF